MDSKTHDGDNLAKSSNEDEITQNNVIETSHIPNASEVEIKKSKETSPGTSKNSTPINSQLKPSDTIYSTSKSENTFHSDGSFLEEFKSLTEHDKHEKSKKSLAQQRLVNYHCIS